MEKFKEYSVSEFFKKNRQMLGFSGKVRAMTTIVHEFVTNSIDAAEEHGILPEVEIDIKKKEDKYIIKVKDNGPGIPKEYVGKALGVMLAGTKFHRYIQQRGQQGIGATGCVMFSLITSGEKVKVRSGNRGVLYSCLLGIDFKNNRAAIEEENEEPTDWHGLEIEAVFGDVKYEKGSNGVYAYLKRTAIANPHVTIKLNDPEGQTFLFPRSIEEIPKRPKESKPHPLGLRTQDLLDLALDRGHKYKTMEELLSNELVRVSKNKAREIAEKVGGLSFSPLELTWKKSEEIVKTIKDIKWIAPPMDVLVPIGKEQLEASLRNIYSPDFIYTNVRSPKVYRGGIPFTVEIAMAYGGDVKEEKNRIIRFANRAPLIFDAGGCAITQTTKKIDWKRYGFKDIENEPVLILVNISSLHIPYTSAGKQSISDEQEVVEEIKNGLMDAARNLSRYLSGKRREKEKAGKRKVLLRYIDQIASDIAALSENNTREELAAHLRRLIEEKYR